VSLLYPRMTERPPNFRINPASPLAQGLVFFGGGLVPGGSRMYDGSVYGNHGTLTEMDPQTDWVWVPELRRWALDFDRSGYCITQRIVDYSSIVTVSSWCYYRTIATSYDGFWGSSANGQAFLAVRPGTHFYLYVNDGNWHNIATDDPQPANTWIHTVSRIQGQKLWIDGIEQNATSPYSASGSYYYALGIYHSDRRLDGCVTDAMLHIRALTDSEIAALADPGNVDLRIGGVPLILPPRRRIFPAAAAGVTGIPRHFMYYQRMSSNVA